MDMTKFSGENFVKVADVRGGPIQVQIAAVRLGQYGKPDLIFETGDLLCVNATNNRTLVRSYGRHSDDWLGKKIELFLGELEYNGEKRPAVLIRPISPPVKAGEQTNKKPAEAYFDEVPY